MQYTLNYRKILMSASVIAFVAALAFAGTQAFYSDEEASTGNVFAAGAIDLRIDNHAWYNGIECAYNEQEDGYFWTDPEGNAEGDAYLESLVGQPCESSWQLKDLDDGDLFFNLTDLKPGDWEEDTISFHVDNNDAWLCANFKATKDNDEDSTEPELEAGDVEDDPEDNWDGELGQELNFIFWADDGDNVLEDNETVVLEGTPSTLDGYGLDEGNYGETFPLVDSTFNVWNGDGPLPAGDEPVYIGKAFCFGDFALTPVAQDGEAETNSPALDPGFTCDGASVTNWSQTDQLMGDLAFYAVQSRNNDEFECSSELFGAPPVAEVVEGDTWSDVDLDEGGGGPGKEWFAKARNNNANFELAVGTDDGGVDQDTAEAVWVADTLYPFTLEYDGAGTATFTVDGETPVTFPVGTGPFGRIGVNAKAPQTVTTEILSLDLSSVAPLAVDSVVVSGGTDSITIESPTINGPWMLTGEFRFSAVGAPHPQENPAVQFSID